MDGYYDYALLVEVTGDDVTAAKLVDPAGTEAALGPETGG